MVPAGVLPGIFLTTAATAILEVSLVRLLSVAQWQHFAFLVVSIALLGFGANGSFLFSFPGLCRRGGPIGLAFMFVVWLLSLLALTSIWKVSASSSGSPNTSERRTPCRCLKRS